MASTVCAFCGVKATMVAASAAAERTRNGGGSYAVPRVLIPTFCSECHMVMVAIASVNDFLPTDLQGADRQASAHELLERAWSVDWYPRTAQTFEFPYVPANIARAAEEAHQAAQIGANMAAILMARTTVEATAKHLGITDGGVQAKIDGLHAKGYIREVVRSAAHTIRHLGNNMAHGDLEDAPTNQDTADVLALMDKLLDEVFEIEAITANIRSRRA